VIVGTAAGDLAPAAAAAGAVVAMCARGAMIVRGPTRRPMRSRHLRLLPLALLLLAPLALFATCSSPHPLDGNWAEQTADGKKGIQIVFATDASRVFVHGRPDVDDFHTHPPASYTFDPATRALAIQCDMLGDGKTTAWTGTMEGDTLQLRSGEQVLRFKKGGTAH
jgi:hypothetical protein